MPRSRTRDRTASPRTEVAGREAELRELGARFDDGARLVTVVAPGGMGKTWLATRHAEAARKGLERHGGTVHWVDLTSSRDRAGFLRAVTDAISADTPKSRDEDAVDRALGRALRRRKRALFVLDNVEPVVAHARASLGAWLTDAPDARFLVTSRVVLDLPHEHVLVLSPLALGRDDGPAPALELFLRRAREVGAPVAESAVAGEVVRDVVARTEGIPLAIELAAARLHVLSLEELRDRLQRPLDVLARRDGAGRHASMRRTVLDSIEALGEGDRELLELASLHPGPFSIAGMEDLSEAFGRPRRETLDAMDRLVASSLLRVEPGSERRLSMFEIVREAAQERLSSNPERLERAERARLGALVRRARAAMLFGGPALPAEDIDDAVASFAAAAAHPSTAGDTLPIALGLGPTLARRGHIALRFELLDRALELAREPTERDAARALVERGIARRDLGDVEGASRDLEDGLARARAAADPALESLALSRLGEIVESQGDTPSAKRTFEAAIGCARAIADAAERQYVLAEAHGRLGHALRREGALGRARAEIERALTCLGASYPAERAALLYEAAVVALFETRYGEAEQRFAEGLSLSRRASARHVEAALASGHGCLLQETGRLEEALREHDASVRLFAEIGSAHRHASALHYLACARLELGAFEEASRIFARALGTMRHVMPRYETLILGAWAVCEASAGREREAERMLDEAFVAVRGCATEPSMLACLEVRRAHVEALRSGDFDAALAAARARASGNENDDVRTALRQLSLARSSPTTKSALLVAADGGSFTPAGSTRAVDIAGRGPLKRILRALVDEHAEGTGEALGVDELVRAGWPGERMGAASGANRVRVALATLRKLGLVDAIRTGRGGYYLDPKLDVRSPRKAHDRDA